MDTGEFVKRMFPPSAAVWTSGMNKMIYCSVVLKEQSSRLEMKQWREALTGLLLLENDYCKKKKKTWVDEHFYISSVFFYC